MSDAAGTTPIQIVEALYEGFRRRDFPAIAGQFFIDHPKMLEALAAV